MKYRFEYSLTLALAATLLYCAILPPDVHAWWSAAFSPLCDGILTADGAGREIVLKSWLWELLTRIIK